jgi:hypothetical protein
VMSKSDQIGLRHPPYAFTEQEVNILIMRAFVKLREIISTHKNVEEKLKDLETKLKEHDHQIIQIIQVISQLITPPEKPKRQMGFTLG